MPRSPPSSPARRQPGEATPSNVASSKRSRAGARSKPAKPRAGAGRGSPDAPRTARPAKAGSASAGAGVAPGNASRTTDPDPPGAKAGDRPPGNGSSKPPGKAGTHPAGKAGTKPAGKARTKAAGEAVPVDARAGRGRIPLWVDLRAVPARRRIPFLRAAQRIEAEAVLVAPGDPEAGRPGIMVVDGDALMQDGRRIGTVVAMDGAAAQQAARDAPGIVLVEGGDWTIIPLENLIAAREDRPASLFALARSPQQAGVFRDTLEHGVHGVALAPETAADIEAAHALLVAKGIPQHRRSASGNDDKGSREANQDNAGRTRQARAKKDAGVTTLSPGRLELVAARVTSVADAGPGDRVCVDATSAFGEGEGLLIGSTARSFVLVHAETIETEFVAARPFRVNAGALHSYVLLGDTTRYLSELRAGAQVMAVDAEGATRTLTVGRAKLERRPHLLIKWTSKQGKGSAVLQNAETIRLVQPGGRPISVTQLKPGDEVLVHHEDAARHFGMPVDEMLEER